MQDIENYFIGSIPQLQILGIALLKATLILVLGKPS